MACVHVNVALRPIHCRVGLRVIMAGIVGLSKDCYKLFLSLLRGLTKGKKVSAIRRMHS